MEIERWSDSEVVFCWCFFVAGNCRGWNPNVLLSGNIPSFLRFGFFPSVLCSGKIFFVISSSLFFRENQFERLFSI